MPRPIRSSMTTWRSPTSASWRTWGSPCAPDGAVLGAFCAIDTQVHPWSAAELALVQELADLAMTELALRNEIFERHRVEAELRASEARYRTLVEHFPNGAIFLFDHALRYTLAGGTGLAAAGLTPDMF